MLSLHSSGDMVPGASSKSKCMSDNLRREESKVHNTFFKFPSYRLLIQYIYIHNIHYAISFRMPEVTELLSIIIVSKLLLSILIRMSFRTL